MFIPPGYMNINMRFIRSGDPEPMITSIGALIEAFDPVTGPNDVHSAVAGSGILDVTTDATTFTGVECVVGTSDPSSSLVLESTNAPQVGFQGEDALPNNCALLVKKITARGGRKGRGRCFYPDLQQDRVSETGELAGVNLTTYQDAWDDLVTALEGVDGITSLVLLHTDSGDGDPDVITNWVVQGKIATQRRRMRP